MFFILICGAALQQPALVTPTYMYNTDALQQPAQQSTSCMQLQERCSLAVTDVESSSAILIAPLTIPCAFMSSCMKYAQLHATLNSSQLGKLRMPQLALQTMFRFVLKTILQSNTELTFLVPIEERFAASTELGPMWASTGKE